MRLASTILFLSILGWFPPQAQTPDLVSLSKVKTAALVVRATSSISCGDGSEGTCVRNDNNVATKVAATLDCTSLWEHFEKADAKKADAIFEVTVKDASATYGRITFSVRDADTNKFLYFEGRDVVMLENDITRIVNHFISVLAESKKKPTAAKKR